MKGKTKRAIKFPLNLILGGKSERQTLKKFSHRYFLRFHTGLIHLLFAPEQHVFEVLQEHFGIGGDSILILGGHLGSQQIRSIFLQMQQTDQVTQWMPQIMAQYRQQLCFLPIGLIQRLVEL